MGGFKDSVVIQSSPNLVFERATRLEDAPKWVKGVIRAELLAPGPLRSGSKFREARKFGKREVSTVIEVTVHDGPGNGRSAPYQHAASSRAMGVHAVYAFTFSNDGLNATRVDLQAEVRATNPLGWIMAPLCLAAMKKCDGQMLARLKQMIEESQGNTANG